MTLPVGFKIKVDGLLAVHFSHLFIWTYLYISNGILMDFTFLYRRYFPVSVWRIYTVTPRGYGPSPSLLVPSTASSCSSRRTSETWCSLPVSVSVISPVLKGKRGKHNALRSFRNLLPRNGKIRILVITIRYKCVHIFILWLLSLPVYNGYYGFNKAGLPRAQQCMLYLYPQLLQPLGVHVCNHVSTDRIGCNTRFTPLHSNWD